MLVGGGPRSIRCTQATGSQFGGWRGRPQPPPSTTRLDREDHADDSLLLHKENANVSNQPCSIRSCVSAVAQHLFRCGWLHHRQRPVERSDLRPSDGVALRGVGVERRLEPELDHSYQSGDRRVGTPIAVLTNPSRVVSSGDGTYLYVVSNNGLTVQRYNPSTATFATKLSILSNNVSQIVAVPGYSDLVVIAQNSPGSSPPAIQSALYQNGSALPNHIGNGLGIGGPDIIAVNDTGTLFYGYQTTVTSYTNWTAAITPGPNGGLTSTSAPTLQNVLTGPRGRIDVADNMLFDDNGRIYDTINPSLLSLFPTTGAFALDPMHHRFYSMVNSGSSQTVDVFDMDVTNSLKLLGTIPATGEVGGVGEITRFGANGLALSNARPSHPDQLRARSRTLRPDPARSRRAGRRRSRTPAAIENLSLEYSLPSAND